jgi:uncharacterized protein
MRRVFAFFVLACAITWVLDWPLASAWIRHETPPSYAMPLVGLGAFGPLFAALIVGGREPFRRWRTRPIWVLIALLMPFALHQAANVLEVALGGHPAHWLYPPNKPEYVAALVFFSVGEEFGWRGLAYPRLADEIGPISGAMITGAVWGVWHLMMMVTPDRGWPAATSVLWFVVDLGLWSVVVAWMFERSGRSMWVALAVHAGGHLDNPNQGPESELRLRLLRTAVAAVAAVFAARALRRR